jgi:hypothetical protein
LPTGLQRGGDDELVGSVMAAADGTELLARETSVLTDWLAAKVPRRCLALLHLLPSGEGVD